MGKDLAKMMQQKRRGDQPPKGDKLRPEETRALRKIKQEAKRAGSFLTSGGKGGLPPSLVLHVMRRDNFTCKVCGELGSKENGGIGVHHKFQHITAPKERLKGILANKQGRRNDPEQMTTICAKDHDKVHQRDRRDNGGKDADEMGGK